MTDEATAAPAGTDTAGALLKRAREKQGLHIAVLAAQIKVPQKKLEALEADRYAELPDATFVRALAQTVCRTLKVDPAPVLALLPKTAAGRLEHVSEGINAPFRDDGREAASDEWSALVLRPAVVVPAVVVLAALGLWLLPEGTFGPRPATTTTTAPVPPPVATAPAAATAAVPATAAADKAAPAASATPAAAPAVAAEPPAQATPATTLQLRASAPSWVEVLDASGASLISRIVAADEVVDLDGALPLKLKIGNVRATQVAFRGQPVELAPYTRDNVARFELK